MKSIPLTICILFLAIPVLGQKSGTHNEATGAKNAIYLSLGGPGVYYSIIYERQLLKRNEYQLGIKAGAGTSLSSALFPGEINFPAGAWFLYGKRHHHLDLSLNFTSYILDQYDYAQDAHSKELRLLYVPSVGYRYQKTAGGFVARAGFSTIIHFNSVTNTVAPWLDLSIGWAF